MNILFLRSHDGVNDSRVAKEIYSISKKHNVTFLGWDRSTSDATIRRCKYKFFDKEEILNHICIKAPIGGGFKKLFFPLLRFWRLEYNFIKKELPNFDAIHACDLDTAFPLLLFYKKIPIVYDIYDYYADTHASPWLIDKLLRKFEGCIIRKSNTVIICNEIRKQQIIPYVPKNLVIIHNAPSVKTIQRTFCVNSELSPRLKVVYVGSLSQDRFLAEMADVITQTQNVELHIGGIGILEEYFSELSGQFSNIIYYGKMSYEDVIALEDKCDIVTAIYDPRVKNNRFASPNKFYEALMLKKPLIMMHNTGMDSFVEKYQLGEVIDGGAESFKEGFSRALDNLIAKKEQWAEMGERGYKLYQEQFSWDEMEKRLLKLYDELESTISKD